MWIFPLSSTRCCFLIGPKYRLWALMSGGGGGRWERETQAQACVGIGSSWSGVTTTARTTAAATTSVTTQQDKQLHERLHLYREHDLFFVLRERRLLHGWLRACVQNAFGRKTGRSRGLPSARAITPFLLLLLLLSPFFYTPKAKL